MSEFFAQFPDDRACLDHVFSVRWGNHTACPRCGQLGRWTPLRDHRKFQHRCRRQVSVLEDTILYRSNLAPMAWFYAMLLFANCSVGMRSSFLRKQLGLGVKSTVRMGQRIRLQMAALEGFGQIGGPGQTVYIDEAMTPRVSSGLGVNRHREPIIVMGFACGDRVMAGIIPDRTGDTLVATIERCVRPGSILVTDGHASYKCLQGQGWQHLVVNHAVAFHDFRGNTTNAIETYWRVLKRTLSGYRQIDADNAWLYLAEVQFRYNRRRNATSIFQSLVEHFPSVRLSERTQLERHFDWRLTGPRYDATAETT